MSVPTDDRGDTTTLADKVLPNPEESHSYTIDNTADLNVIVGEQVPLLRSPSRVRSPDLITCLPTLRIMVDAPLKSNRAVFCSTKTHEFLMLIAGRQLPQNPAPSSKETL